MLSRLGDLISLNEEKNRDLNYGVSDVKGISINKVFIETKANLKGVSLRPYIIVKPKYFAYVTVTSRNGDKVSMAFNDTNETYIVSSSYVSFYVKNANILLPEYLYIYFNRPEFDRIARFNSWGSARETFSWDDLCDLKIHVPSIEIQQKYVNIYKALLKNIKVYESGLNDLILVTHGYIEKLRNKYKSIEIGKFTLQRNEKNTDNIKNVLGISKDGFIKPKTKPSDNLSNYNVFKKGDFVFSPPRINIGSIDLYEENKLAVCSPIYEVFYVSNTELVLPEYLKLWLTREEFYRYTDFMSIASVRNNFDYSLMSEIKIPVPPLEIQKAITDIFRLYGSRKKINESLNEISKMICPLLIKGATQESKGVI